MFGITSAGHLQTECTALDDTASKATNMANKIRSLIS